MRIIGYRAITVAKNATDSTDSTEFLKKVLTVWQKLLHYLFPSVVSLALAGIIARIRFDLSHGLILLFFCLGVVLCLVGGIRLRSYLRQNPPRLEGEA